MVDIGVDVLCMPVGAEVIKEEAFCGEILDRESIAVRLEMSRIREKQGLADDVCSYLVRHTFGTRAVMNGPSSPEVAELMGHYSTEMVDRVCVHLADQVLQMSGAVCRATKAAANGHKKPES